MTATTNPFTQANIDKALTEKPWLTKLDANHYRVTPRTLKATRTRDHGIYRVAVTFDRHGMPEVESCRDTRTGSQCKGFRFHGSCYHTAAVVIHVLKPRLEEAA